jgi:pyruvate ferredoxin oxidoreductase gamma subunit
MYQIRLHGRGGQGVVTAAELIAIAAFYDGKETQAFPSFGVERTGAPIEAFARIDDKPIRTREHVYKPNVIIIQDATLLDSVDVAQGASLDTKVIINTGQSPEQIKINVPAKNIFTIDATKIALEELGRNIVNTVILGAFAKVTGLVSLEALKKAIAQKFAEKGQALVDKNIKAIERAYNLINT